MRSCGGETSLIFEYRDHLADNLPGSQIPLHTK